VSLFITMKKGVPFYFCNSSIAVAIRERERERVKDREKQRKREMSFAAKCILSNHTHRLCSLVSDSGNKWPDNKGC
jgi:hypothetical protein